MTKKKLSLRKKVLCIVIAVVLLFSAVTMTVTKIVYDSIFSRYDVPLSAVTLPRELLYYRVEDATLCGYLYRSTAETLQDGLIVFAPGMNAGADEYLPQIQSLLNYGWSVFAFDATGSCRSGGENSVGFSQILVDMEQTIEYIETNNRFGYQHLILMGHSRGGYAACCVAEQFDVSAVVSISGVNSAMEGVISLSSQYVGGLAYGNYGQLWLYQVMLFGTDKVEDSAAQSLARCNTPALIVHGRQDEQVPVDKYSVISHQDEIPSGNREYTIYSAPGQDGHVNLLFEQDGTANQALMAQIHEFLSTTL